MPKGYSLYMHISTKGAKCQEIFCFFSRGPEEAVRPHSKFKKME